MNKISDNDPLETQEWREALASVLEFEGRLLVIDCGVLFPEAEQPGIDLILPELEFIEQRRKDLALLATYSNEKDFDVSRDRNIDPVQNRIKGAKERSDAVDKPPTGAACPLGHVWVAWHPDVMLRLVLPVNC